MLAKTVTECESHSQSLSMGQEGLQNLRTAIISFIGKYQPTYHNNSAFQFQIDCQSTVIIICFYCYFFCSFSPACYLALGVKYSCEFLSFWRPPPRFLGSPVRLNLSRSSGLWLGHPHKSTTKINIKIYICFSCFLVGIAFGVA